MTSEESPLFCDRCVKELTPGKGDFYVVAIEAFADPTPPVFDGQNAAHDIRREISKLVRQLEDVSERESMDQVHRRLTLYLCGPCYRQWIENPTGEAGA